VQTDYTGECSLSSSETEGPTKTSREILKQVDQLVKTNNLERALQEVKKARDLDPKNIYTFAYEERIQELFTKRQVQQAVQYIPPSGSTVISEPVPPLSPGPLSTLDRSGSEAKVQRLHEEFQKAGLQGFKQVSTPKPKLVTKEALETYKQALLLAWSDGQKSQEDDQELLDLRKSLLVSDEEHEMLNRQAKLECYIFLLKHLLHSSASKSEVEATLAVLRKEFDVSTTEHIHIEANISNQPEAQGRKRCIVVIDDEKQILAVMKEFLTLAHYDVRDFQTSDEALEFLYTNTVDLILCDISLDTSTMNGFLFLESIRRLNHLSQVPFIFITGLNDGLLIRAGKEMGVDDFLIKPIHRNNLLAAVRGKLKRYDQLKILSGLSQQ